MFNQDSLEEWLFFAEIERDPTFTRRLDAPLGPIVEDLLRRLRATPPGKSPNLRSGRLGRFSGGILTAEETSTAQQLFREIYERGGSGLSYTIEDVLEGVALARQPASVPFWQELFDLSRPRDRQTPRRRKLAAAALAFLAIERETPAAYEALAAALRHSHEQVRAQAASAIAQAYAVPERTAPLAVLDALTTMATADRAFEPRFQARMALAILGAPASLDPPDRAYLLRVKLRRDRATRTIAALPINTLAELHSAIQRAFEWDADHLYSFYMSGRRDDDEYEIGCPEGGDWGMGGFEWIEVGDDDEAEDGDEPAEDAAEDAGDAPAEDGGELTTANALLGALGLAPKHTFLYYFDFGDSHEFEVTVLGTQPADGGAYPRLVEASGTAPRQYPSWGGEDEDEDEDEG